MSWAEQVIWWHCYPLRFVAAEAELTATTPVTHRLPQLQNWLDYLIELGANGLMMGPIFCSNTHGYDTLDHFNIDPRLGDNGDFYNLLTAAHNRGIRICLDGVFNHLSREHEIVKLALECGPDTEEGRWIKWSEGYPYLFEGHPQLVELNLENPEVQNYLVEVICHWLGKGVDSWRLDAAYAAGSQAWAAIISRVRKYFPEAFIFAEVIHGDYLDFVKKSGVDSVTQYELWKAIWSALNDVNLHELAWALNRHREFCRGFLPMTFIGNHDTTRIASQLKEPKHLPLAIALLLLLPGIPSIYAGDEQAFTGVKLQQKYGDNAIRPPFPNYPHELAPFGANTLRCYQEIIGIRRRNAWLNKADFEILNVSNQKIELRLFHETQELRLQIDAQNNIWKINAM